MSLVAALLAFSLLCNGISFVGALKLSKFLVLFIVVLSVTILPLYASKSNGQNRMTLQLQFKEERTLLNYKAPWLTIPAQTNG